MKRIEFIQPVESMRGNFGAKQDLRYAENDNKAFESPDGKTNYARNYQPTFIGAKVARTGLKYFAVKVKSATTNSAAWRLVAALMGAMSAIYGWVIKQANIVLQLNVQYAAAIEAGYKGTFHKYVGAAIRESLAANSNDIKLVGPTATVTMGVNPFSDATTAIPISTQVLVKFWKQLCQDGITFKVAGNTGLSLTGLSFNEITPENRWNVLGLSIDENSHVKMGDKYLVDSDGVYVSGGTTVEDGDVFTLTDVAPEP